MNQPEETPAAAEGIHLEAQASGDATVYQAARDQHLHFRDGVHAARRAEGPSGTDECPYPGLAAFGAAQARWFFGRDELTADLAGRLNDCLAEGGPLMVVAPSGAGKSSLLQAGLLPALTRGALPAAGSRHWPHIVFTPTAHPMREAAALIAGTGCPPDRAAGSAAPDGDQLTVMLRRMLRAHAEAGAAAAARAVIVVDQLEELFTLCADEPERRAFIDWLWQLAQADTREGPLALVVCGLRADFYAECANYPQLRQALQASQMIVGSMSQDELREAILYPAEAAGLDIEPGLVELLLRDLGATLGDGGSKGTLAEYDAGRLPLLAHALQATWQQRHGSTLTVDGYRATGGIHHAIATSAERAFSRLDSAGQQAARTVFLHLVKIGDGGEDVRRPASRGDLLRDSRQPAAARAVLDAYTRSRLITQTRDSVEITHEALIRAWPRLSQWIGQDRAGNLIRQDLDDAAHAWQAQGREPSHLFGGTRLAWPANGPPAMARTATRTSVPSWPPASSASGAPPGCAGPPSRPWPCSRFWPRAPPAMRPTATVRQ